MNFINICRPKKEDAYLPSRTNNSISLIDEEMEILFPQEILVDVHQVVQNYHFMYLVQQK